VTGATCRFLTNSQPSRVAQDCGNARSWVRALLCLRCRAVSSPQDAALVREDALREAAISLSLGDGIPLTGRDYRLLEHLGE
jgi:hypothetical protein